MAGDIVSLVSYSVAEKKVHHGLGAILMKARHVCIQFSR